VRASYDAILKGLIRCKPCGCAMAPTHSTKGVKRYRYYVCLNAQKRGWHVCPSKSIPASEIERFVVEQIKGIGRDPALVAETIRQTGEQAKKRIAELEAAQQALERELQRENAKLRELAALGATAAAADRMADRQERIRAAEQHATEVREELIALRRELIDEREIARALAAFDPVWERLCTVERWRMLKLLVERVDYDGAQGTVSVTFHPTGIKTLAQELEESA
jgi:site-specific DNA recombinase